MHHVFSFLEGLKSCRLMFVDIEAFVYLRIWSIIYASNNFEKISAGDSESLTMLRGPGIIFTVFFFFVFEDFDTLVLDHIVTLSRPI